MNSLVNFEILFVKEEKRLYYSIFRSERKILWYKNISLVQRNDRSRIEKTVMREKMLGRMRGSRGKRGREGSKGEGRGFNKAILRTLFSHAHVRIESTSDILRRLVDVERTSSDLLIPTTILTAFVRWSLPGGMIGVVDDRVATPVCAPRTCVMLVSSLSLSLSLSLFLSLYLPASRTPPYVCLCARRGVEKGERWGKEGRREERVRCAGTRVSPFYQISR